jgi:hypothetical protein
MDAREVETSIAAGEQALEALRKCAREPAGTLEAHAAETGLVKRWRPMGLAAMKRYGAQRGTGDRGPAITRADGVLLTRETTRRGRDYCSRFGTFAGARTCDRTAGEPGICPLDAPVNLPERCDAYVLQEWRTVFGVEHPFQERGGVCAQRLARDLAASVLMEVVQEAPEDDAAFYAQRPVPPEDTAGELLVVSVDGQGVPLIKAEAVKLKAKWGTGEQRQRPQEARVGVRDTVDAQPRAPEALAELLVDPEAARARRQREDTRDEAPRAQQVRRLASLVRTKPAVMARIQADAERRDPQHRQPMVVLREGALGLGRLAPTRFRPWKRVTCVRDLIPVVSDRWPAATAVFREASKAGTRGVRQQLTARLRGRVGDVIGGLRPILTKRRRRTSVREALTNVITCFPTHRRWMRYDAYRAVGVPVGTGVGASACGAVVKHRMEGAGQRWSLDGAETMLALRSLKKSHDADLRDTWRFHARQVWTRLYARQPKYKPTVRLRRVA